MYAATNNSIQTSKASQYYYSSKYYYANVPDQLWERNAYGNMAVSELICVRVALYLEAKMEDTMSDVIKQYL